MNLNFDSFLMNAVNLETVKPSTQNVECSGIRPLEAVYFFLIQTKVFDTLSAYVLYKV